MGGSPGAEGGLQMGAGSFGSDGCVESGGDGGWAMLWYLNAMKHTV